MLQMLLTGKVGSCHYISIEYGLPQNCIYGLLERKASNGHLLDENSYFKHLSSCIDVQAWLLREAEASRGSNFKCCSLQQGMSSVLAWTEYTWDAIFPEVKYSLAAFRFMTNIGQS